MPPCSVKISAFHERSPNVLRILSAIASLNLETAVEAQHGAQVRTGLHFSTAAHFTQRVTSAEEGSTCGYQPRSSEVEETRLIAAYTDLSHRNAFNCRFQVNPRRLVHDR